MPKRRSRTPPGECYAQLPQDLIESDAYASLPDYAVRVLVALASEYRGANNGNLSLTVARARKLGVRSAWKVRAGLHLLQDVGLIERTREGKYSYGRGIAALYALGWRAIDPTDAAFPPIILARRAPNAWAQWEKPEDWRRHAESVRRVAKGSAGKWEEL